MEVTGTQIDLLRSLFKSYLLHEKSATELVDRYGTDSIYFEYARSLAIVEGRIKAMREVAAILGVDIEKE